MSLSITPENLSSLSITNESKISDNLTWDEATMTWDEADFTWDFQGLIINKETKNALTLTNEAQN